MKSFQIAVVSLLISLLSCTRVIELDLNTSNKKVIVEAVFSNLKKYNIVKISRTVGFESNILFDGISGAKVEIMDLTAGTSEVLKEDSTGIYSANALVGMAGHAYKLKVTADNQTFEANAVMQKFLKLDSIFYIKKKVLTNNIYELSAIYQDAKEEENFYKADIFVNNKIKKNIYVTNDVFDNGLYGPRQLILQLSINAADTLKIGDVVRIQAIVINREIYQYFYAFNQNLQGQIASPDNPISNISNNALGYFSAQMMDEKSLIIKE